MEIRVSAPGKVILHGEHAVVYGKIAIAASLDLRSYVRLTCMETDTVDIELKVVNHQRSWILKDLQLIAEANQVELENPTKPINQCVIEKINKLPGIDGTTGPLRDACITFIYLYTAICHNASILPSVSVCFDSDLPIGAGLGSSASYSTSLATAFLLQQNLIKPSIHDGDCNWSEEDLMLINKWAFQGERIIHGTPSGIDNSVATYGGALKFQAGKITKLDRLPQLRILLTSTGVPRNTKDLVAKVREKHTRLPGVMDAIMNAVEAVTEQCLQSLSSQSMATNDLTNDNKQFTMLEELFDINQHLLQAMGVSHPMLDRIFSITCKHGLHTKLTGAGGGGCALTLLPTNLSPDLKTMVGKELIQEGFKCFETEVGVKGVTAKIIP